MSRLIFFSLIITIFYTAASDRNNTKSYVHDDTKSKIHYLAAKNDDDPNLRLLKKDSLLIDIKLLKKAFTEMHPGLYRYNTKEEIDNLFEDLQSNLPDEILENEFMILLAQSVSKIKCGHTYLNPWNLNRKVRNRLFGGHTYFPIGFQVINGHFYSTENSTNNNIINRGAEILAINDVPISEIYSQLRTIAKSDGNNLSPVDHYLSLWNYEERSWQTFDLYFQLFYPLKGDSYKITFKNFNAQNIETIKVPAMSKARRAEKMKQKYGNEILEKEKWKLEVVSEELAILRLGTFAIWNWKDFDQKTWFANAFKQVDSLNIKKLAIDIRGNGGGLSEPANELISYLIKDTIKCNDLGKIYIRTTKFNPELIPHIDTWVEVLKEGLPNNMYKNADDDLYELLEPSQCTDISPKTNRFLGEVFILGDASNVSATFTLLDKANQFGFATYIGQESGGNQQGINGGEYAFFTLPYSKMEVDIPLKFFAPQMQKPDAGVQPKVRIDISQSDIAHNADPYINYLKE